MTSKSKSRLWRVEWYHRAGYQAPYQLVEAKTRREAIKLAKGSSRLGDFPKAWHFKLIKIEEPE